MKAKVTFVTSKIWEHFATEFTLKERKQCLLSRYIKIKCLQQRIVYTRIWSVNFHISYRLRQIFKGVFTQYRKVAFRGATKSYSVNRGTQRQFSKNICSEDDWRSRIFGTFVVKISCLPASPRIFEHLKNDITAHFWRIFTLKRLPRIFGSLFSSWNFNEIFSWKVSFDPYNFRITRLSPTKSEQMENF